MITIHKYELEVVDEQIVEMPMGAEILSTLVQAGGQIAIWAKVDNQAPLQNRHILIRGTGHELKIFKPAKFIGTVIHVHGLVWHIFDGGAS